MASTNLRSSCSFPYILLSILNFILFILSAISLAPIIALKMPPTSFGLAFLMVSSISLLSSFVGFYSHLAHFCYITHISLLLSSSIGQFLAILALFTREKSSLRMLKSARDPKEAKVLVRLECGIFMAMFVMQLAVVVLTCAVHSCWVREYEDIEAEKEAMARKRSRRIARVQEESVANAAKISEIKAKEFDEKMKNKYGQWVKNDFEGSRTGQPAPATFSNTDQTTVFHLFLQEKSRNCLSVLLEIERSMISTIMIHRAEFLRPYTHEFKNHQNFQRVSASWTMRTMDSKPSQKEELSVQVPKPQSETVSLSNLQFDRQRPPEEAFTKERRIDFGQFTTREAVLDEEFWTAAWLRAESRWEERRGERYVENYKRKFTEQEFNSIKRRCKSQLGHKSTCILAVKKERMNVVNTVLKSVVGTLDLSIRHLLHGEAFPGEPVKTPLFCSINKEGSKYGYISNLCVAKSARRQGIASNMLSFAIRSAKENGAEQVFVHVHRNNRPAQELYQKMGFQVVEMATFQLAAEQTYLLCLRA